MGGGWVVGKKIGLLCGRLRGMIPNIKTYFDKKVMFLALVPVLQQNNHPQPGVILGQNCVQLSDAALNDLFFSKISFVKNNLNML